MSKARKEPKKCLSFGDSLGIEELVGLRAELQVLRDYPPIVKRSDGKYEGDILGFVKGLRLSARVIYFLRNRLSCTGLDVNWGHILDDDEKSCSPECDIIVHSSGHVRKWNGNDRPIMDFKFVKADQVLAVVSCKSKITSIDKPYVDSLKTYGVNTILLFAECCAAKSFAKIQGSALKAGYKGFWCLYTTDDSDEILETNDQMLIDFGDAIYKAVSKNASSKPNHRFHRD
jgi:hypothetical protein